MTPSAPLDPRAPFVLDTRALGRRPGSMRRVTRSVAAPDGGGLELVRVPPGVAVELDLRLESVVDGVLVSGTVRAPVAAECGRCLDPVTDEVCVEVQELYAYEPAGDDEDQPLLVGDFLDIEPLLRDAVVLGLPLNPVCDDGCQGLCPTCGARMADLEDNHSHEDLDPRWAALTRLSGDAGATPSMTHTTTHPTES